MDGEVVIGLKLDSKELESQLHQQQKQLQKFEKEAEKLLKTKAEIEVKIKTRKEDIEKQIGGKWTEIAENKNKQYNQWAVENAKKIISEARNADTELQNLEARYKEIDNEIQKNADKQQLVTKEIQKTRKNLDLKGSFQDIGNSVEKVTKKVMRWGLAIFGVRSAYLAIRQAMSTLSQYDEKLSADLQYIRFALATMLKPIIEWIVNAVYTLLQYINYIAQAWFGINLFANASVKNFKSANKSAKDLKNTIAGFDEMNVLNDNSSSGSGGIPGVDLSKNAEIPKWLEIIGNAKDFIADIVPLIAIIFATLFKIKKLGLYIAIYGIYKTIKSIIKFIKEPTFENFLEILKGIAITVSGIAILFGAWPVAIGGAIALVIVELVKHFDKIKEMFNNLMDWLDKNVLGTLRNLFGPIGDIIYLPIETAVTLIKSTFENLIGSIKRVIEGIVKLFQGDFLGGLKDIFGGLVGILTFPFNVLKDVAITVFNRVVEFYKGLAEWMYNNVISPIANFFSNLWEGIKNGIVGVWNKITSVFGALVNWFNNNVIQPFAKLVNGFLDWLKGKGYSAGGGGGGSFGGGGSGGGFRAKGGVFYPRKLPKLAVGGIINNPGYGVPYNGATIAERGAEAVLPLTDSQQMQLLGEAIGKYITVNANITNTMNGRVLSRELQKVQNDNDFAYNR